MDTVAPWMDAFHEERRLQVNEQQTSFHNEQRTVDAFADGPGVALLGLIFVLFAVFAAIFALCSYCNVGDRINLMLARRRNSQTTVELPPEVAMMSSTMPRALPRPAARRRGRPAAAGAGAAVAAAVAAAVGEPDGAAAPAAQPVPVRHRRLLVELHLRRSALGEYGDLHALRPGRPRPARPHGDGREPRDVFGVPALLAALPRRRASGLQLLRALGARHHLRRRRRRRRHRIRMAAALRRSDGQRSCRLGRRAQLGGRDPIHRTPL